MVASGATVLEARGSGLTEAIRCIRRTSGFLATTSALAVESWTDRDVGPVDRALRAQRAASRLLAVHGIDVRVTGPLPRGRVVIVANHVSYLDPLVVGSVIACATLAKAEARRWPLVGDALAALGAIFVQRGDVASGAVALLKARRVLLSGASVLNFPEGTTTCGATIGPFRPGMFGLARITGVDVVPGHVSYDDPRVHWFGGRSFVPHYLALSRFTRVVATLRFGAPLDQDGGSVAERAREAVAALGPTPC
jgi:1-acyl-sn-glycerol-3-phosphate acyltransferase